MAVSPQLVLSTTLPGAWARGYSAPRGIRQAEQAETQHWPWLFFKKLKVFTDLLIKIEIGFEARNYIHTPHVKEKKLKAFSIFRRKTAEKFKGTTILL